MALADLDSNVVFSLSMNDDTVDASGNKTFTNNGVTFVTGKVDKAGYFASGDYAEEPSTNSFGTTMTIGFWFKSNTAASRQSPITRRISSINRQWLMATGVGVGDMRMNFYNGSSTARGSLVSTTIVTDNSWHLIMITQNGDDVAMYIDDMATPEDTDSTAGKVTDTQRFNIGGYDGASQSSDMALDVVTVWDTVLTQSEREEFKNSGDAIEYPFSVEGVSNQRVLNGVNF